MKKVGAVAILVTICIVLSQCQKAEKFPEEYYDARLSGGLATVFDESSKAFTHAIPAVTGHDLYVHDLGDKGFEQTFVSAPAPVNSGLGPLYNNVSCISCHHNDGKGTPTAGLNNSSMLLRISIPGQDPHGGPLAANGYGGQLQDLGILGKTPEVKIDITYTEETITYPDGSTASIRKPKYNLYNWYIGAPANFMVSPRMAPPVFGMGLLEMISERMMKAMADENDADGDGISGRINYVYNAVTQKTEPGKFGLKANNPTIATQVAGAFNQDMGITSSIFPTESVYGQSQADKLTDDPELADTMLNAVIFYIKTLAVPARRNVAQADVVAGEQLFKQINCSGCHIPTLQTDVDVRFPYLSNQRIHPFTDLLLHDMGDGLSDNRPDFLATGNEWRTAPLWGIGLFEKTNGTPYYLHDGRARTIEEAILWHDGEAKQSKNKFMNLSSAQRKQLVTYIRSL